MELAAMLLSGVTQVVMLVILRVPLLSSRKDAS